MTWHYASIWEAIADAIPDAPALACGETRRSWRAFEERGARVAAALAAAGLERGAKVGLYASNCNEYLEAQFGVFKAGRCPINVNYRYSEAELVYLLDNAEAEALVFDARFAPRVAAIREQLPQVKLLVAIDDGSGGDAGGRRRVRRPDRRPCARAAPAADAKTTSTCSTPAARPACPRA